MKITTMVVCTMIMAVALTAPAAADDDTFNWFCFFSPLLGSCYV